MNRSEIAERVTGMHNGKKFVKGEKYRMHDRGKTVKGGKVWKIQK